MTYYNEVMADWTDSDDDNECKCEVEGRKVGWISQKRADEEQKSLRTECKILQRGNRALRETAEMLSREIEDTYKDLEATEVERDGMQRKLQEQEAENREQKETYRLRLSERTKELKEKCQTLKSGNRALRETTSLLTMELEDTYEALSTAEEDGDKIQKKLEDQRTNGQKFRQ